MKRPAWPLFLLLLLSVTGCDHTTKYLASSRLANGRVLGIIPGLLDLRWVANTDTAFSLMHSYVSEKTRLGILTAVSIFTTIAIGSFVAFRWRKASTTERIAGALLLGGGLGNVVDRLAHGHVVDFIHLHYWPVFNVADISLCLGVGLLFLSSLRQKQAVI